MPYSHPRMELLTPASILLPPAFLSSARLSLVSLSLSPLLPFRFPFLILHVTTLRVLNISSNFRTNKSYLHQTCPENGRVVRSEGASAGVFSFKRGRWRRARPLPQGSGPEEGGISTRLARRTMGSVAARAPFQAFLLLSEAGGAERDRYPKAPGRKKRGSPPDLPGELWGRSQRGRLCGRFSFRARQVAPSETVTPRLRAGRRGDLHPTCPGTAELVAAQPAERDHCTASRSGRRRGLSLAGDGCGEGPSRGPRRTPSPGTTPLRHKRGLTPKYVWGGAERPPWSYKRRQTGPDPGC